jgi:hypothetical protein
MNLVFRAPRTRGAQVREPAARSYSDWSNSAGNVEDIVDSTMRPVCQDAFEGLEAAPKAPILQLCDESTTSGAAILDDLTLRFISLPL